MKNVAIKSKLDRVLILSEAIKIARELGLEEFPGTGGEATIKGVSNQGLPLYYLGYRLLEAEKKALLTRESDEPFIEGLRTAEEKLRRLVAFELSENDFSVRKVDKESSIGQKVWPRYRLVLIVAVLIGFALSIVFILLRHEIVTSSKNKAIEVK